MPLYGGTVVLEKLHLFNIYVIFYVNNLLGHLTI